MYRCDRSIVFDLVIFITAIVVIIFASLCLNILQQLKESNEITGSQLNKIEGAFVFSIIVIVWAAIVFFWAGGKLISDIFGGQDKVKITTPPPTIVPAVSTKIPDPCPTPCGPKVTTYQGGVATHTQACCPPMSTYPVTQQLHPVAPQLHPVTQQLHPVTQQLHPVTHQLHPVTHQPTSFYHYRV